MSDLRKFVLSAIAVPVLGMTMITAQPLVLDAPAYAAATTHGFDNKPGRGDNNDRGRDRTPKSESSRGSDDNYKRTKFRIPLCPPGVAETPNCRKPKRVSKVGRDCTCQVKTVNGVRTRDCYAFVDNVLRYCGKNLRR